MIQHPQDKIGAIRNPEGLWINTEVFSEEAKHFRRYGRYTDAAPGTLAYKEYWDEQLRRKEEGYSVGGARISGHHYNYLNFCPIKRINEGEAKGVSVAKKRDFPDFWDHDYAYFHSLDIARHGITQEELTKLQLGVTPKKLDGGHHVIVSKTRRRGYSYKGGNVASNCYDTVKASLTMLTAFEKKFLSPKGVLAMFNSQMSHIDANTAFAMRREYNNTAYHKRASFKKYVNGTPTEAGFLSEMMALSFKDDPDASRGGDAYLVIMDEAGEWPGMEQAYKVLQPLCEDGMYITGQIIIFGTGGSMESGSVDFAKMFYDPDPYNLLAFENIWDDDGEGSDCGFFVPDFKNKVGFIDKQGNSKEEEARAYEEGRRNVMLAAGKKEAYNQHIQEYPFCIDGEEWISHEDFGVAKIKDVGTLVGNKEVFEATLSNGQSIRMTDDHEVSSMGIWTPLNELELGDIVDRKAIHFNNVNQVVEIDFKLPNMKPLVEIDEDWGYFIGYFMGDGSYYGPTNTVEFAFDSRDTDIINMIAKFMDDKLGTNSRVKQVTTGGTTVLAAKKELRYVFDSLGMLKYEKERLKRRIAVPDYIFKSPKNVVAAFLSGLFDADGYVTYKHGKRVSFFTKYEQFAKDVLVLLSGFELYPKLSIMKKINGEGREYTGREIRLRVNESVVFCNEVGFKIHRKKIESDLIKEHKAVNRGHKPGGELPTITEIKSLGERPVYDLTTSDRTISLRGLRVHNCPAEAFLVTGDNRFPIKALRRAKNRLEKSGMYKGIPFSFTKKDNDEIGYAPDLVGKLNPIYKYAGILKDNTGAPVMFKAPVLGQSYKIGYDTIQQDEGESLAAFQVYLDSPHTVNHNRIEACFYGRDKGPDDCDQLCHYMARLYNDAEIMHENMFRSTKNNFKRWQAEDLLSSQPDLVIKNAIKESKVEREFGTHMNDKIKLEGCLIAARMLERQVGVEEDGTPILYLDTIRDLRLLEELIRFNFTGNFDAAMAFLMRAIQDEEDTLRKIASNPNTQGIGTELEELRNFRNVKGR